MEEQDFFEDNSDNDYQDYDEDQTWGQERGLCDMADNCYGCPYAAECF